MIRWMIFIFKLEKVIRSDGFIFFIFFFMNFNIKLLLNFRELMMCIIKMMMISKNIRIIIMI
jgi:hypothetical protein